jgi:hypothetical protein
MLRSVVFYPSGSDYMSRTMLSVLLTAKPCPPSPPLPLPPPAPTPPLSSPGLAPSPVNPTQRFATLYHAPSLALLPITTLSNGYCTRFSEPYSLLRLGSFLPIVFRRRASPFRCRRRGPSVTPTVSIRCRAYADAHC